MTVWVIARRELDENRLTWILGPFCLLMAWVLPPLKGMHVNGIVDARGILTIALAAASTWGLAAFYGMGMIARDLEERRFGFYLSLPVSEGAILGGKLLAGMLISMANGLVILLPPLFGIGLELPVKDFLALAGSLMIGALILMLLFHAVAVMVRSRSIWVFVDLAVAGSFAGLAGFYWREMLREGAFYPAQWLVTGFFAASLLLLLLGAYRQVTIGRGNLRCGHRVLSLTFAMGLGVSTLLGGAYALWVLHPGPLGLVSADVMSAASRGDWIALNGWGHWRGDYRAAYLLNLSTGRSWKVDSPFAEVSADGSRALWWERFGEGLWTVDLTRRDFRPQRLNVQISHDKYFHFCLTPDGKHLVSAATRELQVLELETGRWLISKDYAGNFELQMVLLSPERLRVYSTDLQSADLVIQEMDLTTGKLATTGRIQGVGSGTISPKSISTDPGTNRMLIRTESAHRVILRLCEGDTGRTIRELASGEADNGDSRALFLEDGRILIEKAKGNLVQLSLLDAQGRELDHWELDLAPFWVGKSGEPRLTSVWGIPRPGFVTLPIGCGDQFEAFLELDLASRSAHSIPGLAAVRGRDGFQGKPVLWREIYRREDGSLVSRRPDGTIRQLTHRG